MENPLAVREHGLCAAILLAPDVSFHALHVHWTGDVVFVRRELDWVDWLEEGLNIQN